MVWHEGALPSGPRWIYYLPWSTRRSTIHMIVRSEIHKDHGQVRALHLSSFPSSGEADLVDALRLDGDADISLVAELQGEIIGHVMFSKMQAPFKALGLAPISVRSDNRRCGIAQTLIEGRPSTSQIGRMGWCFRSWRSRILSKDLGLASRWPHHFARLMPAPI